MAISTHRRNNLTGLHPSASSKSISNSNIHSLYTKNGNAFKSIRMRVCFSFAAYAKALIDHLITNCNVPVHQGLTDDEFRLIETALSFRFPPDLRSILSEGLPVGAGFPNWRSASKQQLQLLINLPILGICKSVHDGRFWMNGWGVKPRDRDQAVELAERKLRAAPMLIPVYKTFYIPSEPNLAGNPVFEVIGGDVNVAGFDIAGFFERRAEFSDRRVMAPPWKATEARKVNTWTEMAEVGRGGSGGWWWWLCDGEFGNGLEDAFWRLRDGGWDLDEVEEMMRMDGQDCVDKVGQFEMDGQFRLDKNDQFEMDGQDCVNKIDHFEMDGDKIHRSEMDGRDHVDGIEMEGEDGMMKGRLCELLIKSGWRVNDAIYSLDLGNGM